MTDIDALAKSVALMINGVVDYWPEFERREITSERLVVVPTGMERGFASRGLCQTDYLIDVGVLRRVTEDDVPLLVKQVGKFGRTLLGCHFGEAQCVEVKYEPLYSVEHLRERQQFTAVLRLRLRTIG